MSKKPLDDSMGEGHPERVFDVPGHPDHQDPANHALHPGDNPANRAIRAGDTPGPYPVLFGNENYVQPKRGRAAREGQPKHTQEEWLVEAQEVEAVLERGDHVSPELEKEQDSAHTKKRARRPGAGEEEEKDEQRRSEPARSWRFFSRAGAGAGTFSAVLLVYAR
jgi:hypothetical protein